MRKTLPLLIVAAFIAGCASKPPTALEQRWFNIETNYTPVVVVKTNIVPVTMVQTNYLVITNVSGVQEFRTNLVPYFVYETNVVRSTITNEDYVYTPGAGAAAIRESGTAVGNIFGVGGLVGTALGGLFSLWGYVRSRKRYVTAANIAQTVETLREFIKQLPNGPAYDAAFVQWMQTNQANAGVIREVTQIVANEVSNPDAREAMRNIQTLIDGLRMQGGTAPLAATKLGI